jgi:hypothetical protein
LPVLFKNTQGFLAFPMMNGGKFSDPLAFDLNVDKMDDQKRYMPTE